LRFFWDFWDFCTHILTDTRTYTHSYTHIHTSHTLTYTHHTLIHISLIRVIVSIRYNGCRDSSCKWNSKVKRARPGALWGWVTEREVIVSVWIEVIEGVIKWSKKSYMHSFSFYLGFYNFKIFWTFFWIFWIFLKFPKFYPRRTFTSLPGIKCYPRRTHPYAPAVNLLGAC
jgi:hypothetical protein